jgi:hypothetical protein
MNTNKSSLLKEKQEIIYKLKLQDYKTNLVKNR